MAGEEPSEDLRKELVAWVRKEIGPIASPDLIQFAPGLPKTRSGKIMPRILRKIAEDEFGSLGEPSTLRDPGVVDDVITNRQNKRTQAACSDGPPSRARAGGTPDRRRNPPPQARAGPGPVLGAPPRPKS